MARNRFLRVGALAAALSLAWPGLLSAGIWPGFEGLYHQNSSATGVNVGSGCAVKWDARIVPGWDLGTNLIGGGTVRAGTFNPDNGCFYSRNLSAHYGYLGLVGTTYDTYTVANGKFCHAVFLDMNTGTVKNCISTNQWWGTKWNGADALETCTGEQVVAWDPDTAAFHMMVGGDQCSHRSYKPLANMAGFVFPTPVTGVNAWESMSAYPGFVSSRGTCLCGDPQASQPETRDKADAVSGNPPLSYDEWDAGTVGTASYPANRSSYMEVQPGSDYLTTSSASGHEISDGIQIANKYTGVCAHRVDQMNYVYDLAASPISAGGTPMFKRYGATIHQGNRIYMMGPWDTDAATTGTTTIKGMRLACIQYGNQDLQENDGYAGEGASETAVPTGLVFDYHFDSTGGSYSWIQADSRFINLPWLAEGDGVWVAWKPARDSNFQVVRATSGGSSAYDLSIGSGLVLASLAETGGYRIPYNQDMAYSSTANRLALYTKATDQADPVNDHFYLTVFDCATGAERWTYDLATHFTITKDTYLAAIDFSRMTVAGNYAIVSWVDNSGTYATLKAVAIDIGANSAPSSAPAVFSYVMDGSSTAAVETATYGKTRVRDLVPLEGVVYALVHESNEAGGAAGVRNNYVAAQRVIAIASSTRSTMSFNWSVSPDSGAGKVVAVGDASGCSTTDAGGITSYEWDFDYDHITFNADAAGAVVNHTFSAVGSYTVALRLADATHSEIMVTTVEVTASSSGTLTYENGSGIEDTFAQKSTSTWRPATNVEFQIHGADLSNESCAILKFDVSGIPGGSTIDSAVMQVYTFNRAGSGTFSIGTFPSDILTVSGACWDYRNIANNAWSAVTPIASAGSFGTAAQPGSTGWVSFDVADAVQDWVDGTATNNGLGIWASGTVDDRFHAVENSTDPALSPKVTINYSGSTPAEEIYAVHPGSAAAESYPSTSNIAVNWGSEGPITTVDLYYSTTAGTGPWTSIASGESNDGSYSWNAAALGGSATVWVRVTKGGDAAVNAVSAHSFAITAGATHTVSGTVTVTGDSTVENGVTIRLASGATVVDSQVLDATGTYSLDVPDGTYAYELAGPGYLYAVTTPAPNSIVVAGGNVVQDVAGTATADSAAWSWDGNAWADPTPYLSPITPAVKTSCRTVLATGQGFGRVAGRMGQIGDSITNSQSYFTGTLGGGVGTNETGHDFNPIMGWLSPAVTENSHSYPVAPNWNCWYRNANADYAGTVDDWHKGTPWSCVSGWRISDAIAAGHPATVVTNMNMSWAVIMYGTNDVDVWGSGTLVADSNTWKASYKAFVQGFIDRGVIPVLSTIPPEHAYAPDGGTGDERYTIANQRIVEIADELNIPYIDFYGWITAKQPGNAWDGALHGEPRLINLDGTHPSDTTSNFSQTALTVNGGYRARTMLSLAMAEKIKAIVFDDGDPESADLTITTASLPDGALGEAYSTSLSAVNGTPPYAWSEVGDNLPAGITLAADGTLDGTPSEAGTFTVTFRVTDDVLATDDKTLDLTITATQSVTLNPIQDAYVDSSNADTNYGTNAALYSQGNNTNTYARLALAQFDLSGIDPASTVESATLRVYCSSENAIKGGFARIFGVNNPWTEGGVTYNRYDGTNAWTGGNANGALDATATTPDNDTYENLANVDGSSNPIASPPYQSGAFPNDDWGGSWIEFDVASLVADWVDGSHANHGLAVCTTGYVGSHGGAVADPLYGYNLLTWHSREGANRPELVIEYTAPPSSEHVVTFQTDATPGATLTGDTVQTVAHGGNCTPVTAVAPVGYSFTGWTGGAVSAVNPLTVTNVTANLTITANFALNSVAIVTDVATVEIDEGSTNSFQVKLSAQPIADVAVAVARTAGDADVPVSAGEALTFTTANWADWQTVTLAAAEDGDAANGTATISCSAAGLATVDVTANEVDNDYTLTVTHSGSGTTVPDGASVQTKGVAVAIAATADGGSHFTGWSLVSGTATFGNAGAATTTVTASVDTTVCANFAEDVMRTVVFVALEGGTVDGAARVTQTVVDGEDCAPVEAIADADFTFSGWSGDVVNMDNPLTVTNVTADLTLLANFAADEKVAVALRFPVSADEANVPGSVFSKAPKVWATYYDPIKDPVRAKIKKAAAKVVTKILKDTTVASVDVEWKKKVRLYDLKAFKGEQKIGTGVVLWLENNPVQDLNVSLQSSGKEDKVPYADGIRTMALACPRLDAVRDAGDTVDVTDLAGRQGQQLLLKGRWFGNKPPKVWLEYILAGKLKSLKLKVIKPYAFDVNGKVGVSVMDNEDGASEMLVQLPAVLPAGIAALAIENGVGIACAELTAP